MKIISPELNIMIKASEKASKALIRDFGEIEKLQVSAKGPSDFVSNADTRSEKIIINEGATIKSSEIIGTYDDVKGSKPSEVVKEEKIEEEPKAEEAVSPPPAPAPIKQEVKEPAAEA